MKVRHYDETSGRWIIDGASNASELELTNPGFLDESGESISIDHGFTKLDNRMTQLEKNLAWIYLNGAKGGSGGGPGGGDGSEYTFELDSTTFYTSSSSIDISLMIKSANVKKSFTIIATDVDTNRQIGTWKRYSMSKVTITLSDLTGTTNIELSAFDDNSNYVTPVYITIVAGAISLVLNSNPPKTVYIGSASTIPVTFRLNNNTGNSATFILKMNNSEVSRIENIEEVQRDITEYMRDYIFPNNYTPTAGTKFKFEASATTTLDEVELTSNILSYEITVADGNKLTIITDSITEFEPSDGEGQTIDDLTQYVQGSQLGFGYLLSYAPITYSTFNIEYQINLVSSSGTTTLSSGVIPNVMKGISQRFTYSTTGFSPNEDGEYINIHLRGYAVDSPGNTDAQDEADVYCRIVQGSSSVLYANNDRRTLIAGFNSTLGNGFPNNTTGTWNYKWPTSGEFAYTGGFSNNPILKESGINISLQKVNGTTSGYIQNTDGNGTPAIILSGESYGQIEELKYLMPASDIADLSVFTTGFHLSLTYKAEESSNSDLVICSLGKYNQGMLTTGYEITVSSVKCKIGSLDESVVSLPQNELLTVDLDISKESGIDVWYFRIYVNGVLSAVSRVQDYDWKFGLPLTLGCRNDNGSRSNFSNVNIYDIKMYTSPLSEVAVVQNYISSVEHAQLKNGEINSDLDLELRSKNFFNSAGKCIIWRYNTENDGGGEYQQGRELYSTLVDNMEIDTPYPILLLTETSTSSRFEEYAQYIYEEGNKEAIMAETFPVNIKYHDKYNTSGLDIVTPDGALEGVRVGLQGTSSLTYTSKNFELYLGDVDNTGKKLLFQPKNEWLPENEFTLKADVMDSAHANNVVIGKTINNLAKAKFSALPPMELGNDVWGGDADKANSIRDRLKFTSEGFPVLLFITFASGTTKFLGIYNFNLGRYAFYNLGLKILTDYTKESQDGPTLVKEYTENHSYYDNNGGVYSMEINQNDSGAGAFQQDDLSIVRFMADHVYDSRNNEDYSYQHFQKLYTQLANMTQTRIQKMRRNASNTGYEEIPGSYYEPTTSSTYYSFSQCNQHLNWNNACNYYLFALLFGMVDSMCKNLSLRNWGGDIWHTCFYDMDTAFGLNNGGQDNVYYYAHLHKYFNNEGNPTTPTFIKNVPDESGRSYACYWNRIWEILENLPIVDATGIGGQKTLEELYVELRRDIFPDPAKFIEDQYVSYTNNTGAIVFNYDYKIKYFKKKMLVNADGSISDSSDFSQLKFLHGNRTISVKDWFIKRVYFLDSVYIQNRADTNLGGITSPRISLWNTNKSFGGTGYFSSNISTSSKMLISYSYASGVGGSFWADETPTSISLPMPGGQTTITIYGNPFITSFDNFKHYSWNILTNVNFPLLEELDLSGNYELASDLFSGGVYDVANDVGLKNIRVLNLSGITIPNASYTLDVSNCNHLQELDISDSSITSVLLPTSAILKRYKLARTNITSLEISNQSFLVELDITGCTKLTSLKISNCASLKTLVVPSSVSSVEIISCESFESLSIPYTSIDNSVSPLVTVNINTCPNLKIVDLSGQNNAGLNINLVGAYNLESLNLSNILTTNITLASKDTFTSLRSLNISNTTIKYLKYDEVVDESCLDLTNFPNLEDIYAYNCKELEVVKCANNEDNPIELQNSAFRGCSKLKTLKGHFSIQGSEVFRSCSSLTLNRIEGEDFSNNATNITIDTTTLYYCFEGCASLTYADFKYIMLKLNDKLTILEGTFKDCYNISGAIWRDIFKPCPNLTSIKEAFSGTSISGIFYSRDNYIESDDSTYGILDFCKNLVDAEKAFQNTKLEWIDNNAFAPIGNTYSSLGNVDNMFRNCALLKSAENTRASNIVSGKLSSSTFFTNLRNLINIYPKGVFEGCRNIIMEIDYDDDGNILLFHTFSPDKKVTILDNNLYTGVILDGEVTVNVFGGITKELNNGWYIPTINSIHYPFFGTTGATIQLSNMGKIFEGIAKDLYQAVRVFQGLTCIGNKEIPSNIFKGCIELNSIEGIFEGLDLGDGVTPYVFPPKGMFDDCVKLSNISGIFRGCYNLKLSLVGEGFKNCILDNVSEAFAYSGVYGMIPYRLFFMTDGTSIKQTISNISNVFNGCWCLGYDINRKISVGDTISEDSGSLTSWSDHIVANEGSPVYYKLSYDSFEKSINFDKDTRETIPNPDYIEDVDSRPSDYDPNTPETIDNPDYNPDDMAYDVWYLDGSGYWPTPSTENETKVKNRLYNRYFIDDEAQKLAVTTDPGYITDPSLVPTGNEHYPERAYQNYAIPTDYFRYCSSSCTLSNSLSGLFYKKHILESSGTSSDSVIVETDTWEGLRGRIPPQLFKSLSSNINLSRVFKGTRFSPYVGLYVPAPGNSGSIKRGKLYPEELFKYNTYLQDISSIFEDTEVIVGTDISENLFRFNTRLRNISRMWANCTFNGSEYLSDGRDNTQTYTQIPFEKIFQYNTSISNASGLFSVGIIDSNVIYGLRLIEDTLLKTCYSIQDISSMFYYNTNMVGKVPPFLKGTYPLSNTVSDYLTGCTKDNIKNLSDIDTRLIPTSWL